MKKLFILIFVLISIFNFTSCKHNKIDKILEKTSSVISNDSDVESFIIEDKEYMLNTYGTDYVWYETCLLIKDSVEDESGNNKVKGVSNIFQVIEPTEDGNFNTKIIFISHMNDSIYYKTIEDFWIEDFPIKMLL